MLKTTSAFLSLSLAAVLFALALGVLIGVAIGDTNLVSSAKSGIVHDLNSEVSGARKQASQLRQQLSHDLGRGHVAARLRLLAEVGGPAVHRGQRPPGGVVHHLGVDVIQAPEDGQPRPLRGADHPRADAEVPHLPPLDLLSGQHYLAPAFLPTFLRMCSSAYLMPLPL